MQKTEFAGRLNADLGTEFQSIVQYVQHVATIKGAEAGDLALPDVAEALRPLLEHTQDRVIELRAAPEGKCLPRLARAA
jgi:bacterioferritin